MSIASERLSHFDIEQAAWVDQIIQARWLEDSDRCSKMFFKSFKGLSASKQIRALFDKDGNIVTCWEDMANVTSSFFKEGLGECAPNPEVENASLLEHIMEVVSDKLTPAEKECLNAPSSLEELGESTRSLKSLSVLGRMEFRRNFTSNCGPCLVLSF